MRRFLPAVLCLFLFKTSYQQIIASADTSICSGGTATLAVISAPSYGTSSYTFETIPYTPEAYAGVSPVQAGGGGLSDDSYSTAVSIGFNFCFLDETYSQCYIGSNGWVSFGGPGALTTTYTSASIPSLLASVPKNCIMGPWQDWHPGLCSPVGSCVKYQTIGVAPNRKFVVSWDNVPMFSCTTTYGSFQIVINETTNIIENHLTDKPNCLAWAGGTATQGVHSLDGLTAFTAPGRNSTPWVTANESTRFVPNGITWFDGVTVVGYGDTLIVSPLITTTFTASLTACDGTAYTEDVVVTVINTDPSFNYDPFYCTTGIALPTITGAPGGTFTALPAGMAIDPITGAIDLAASIPGSYSVTYTVAGICPTASASDLVTIIIDPDASFGYDDITYCPTGTTIPTFITTVGGTFSVSPAGLSVDPATGLIDLTSGTIGTTYTITYTVGFLCIGTFTYAITIVGIDDPSFMYSSANYCPTGTTSPIFITTPGGTFSVTPGSLDVDPATGLIDLTTGIIGVTYTITYNTPAGPCTNNSTTTVTIDPLDDPAFNYSASSYCPSGTMAPSSIATPGGTFTIFPGTMGIDPASGTVNLSTGDVGTIYTITYTTAAGPCSNTTTTTLEIDPLDDPYFSYADTDFCNYGTAAIIAVTTPGGTYTVSPAGLTVNATTGLIDLATGTPGSSYTITYTTPAGLCSNTFSILINIMPLTDAVFTFDNTAYCAKGTVLPNYILNAGGSFISDPGLSINNLTGEINLAASTPGGPYGIFYTSPGCPETDTFEVLINPLPIPTITMQDVVCLEGDPVLLIGDPAGGYYSGTAVIDDTFSPALAGIPGTYSASYTYTDINGCSNTATANIEVIQNFVDAGMDVYIAEYTTTVLNASGGVTFLWEPPGGLDCNDCATPIVDTLFTTTYTVTSWDMYGCIDQDEIIVTIVPVFDPVVFIPNTFTPNGDNINDFFFAFGTDLESILSLNIFDRWGELVFFSENLNSGDYTKGWDGTFKGDEANQGVYVYMMEVLLDEGVKQLIKGNVTLIR